MMLRYTSVFDSQSLVKFIYCLQLTRRQRNFPRIFGFLATHYNIVINTLTR